MRILLISIFFATLSLNTQAQDGTEFDFWLGNWELRWEYGDSTKGYGVNYIEKNLDQKVIQENFQAKDDGPYKGFKGTSISVFNPNRKTWHQAWADNQGGYFNFMGEVENGQRIFKTSVTQADGTELLLRMRFHDIEENSLTWDWEQSTDSGKSWSLRWRIYYKRIL